MANEPTAARPRLLWIKTELLHPVDKGGKIRTYEMLRRLKDTHHITYLTLDDNTASADDRARASEYCDELVCVPFAAPERGSARFYLEVVRNVASKLPYAIARYRSAAMRQAISAQAVRCDVVVCDFLVSAINMPVLQSPTVLFQHNVEAEIWRRHAANRSHALSRLFFHEQFRRMQRFERRACQAFDSVIAVSAEDCELMRRNYGLTRVDWVPTGVDTEFFTPDDAPSKDRRTLVFTGSMDWMPNEDAIAWFVAEVMPIIKRTVSDARLVVVGRNPGVALKELAVRRDDIVVTGRVEDVRPFVRAARCFVAPIRIGGGTRLKICEALAVAKPVVSTTIGAEGLPLAAGQDLLLADDPQSFAAAVVSVLTDDTVAAQLAQRGLATVREKFGWGRVAQRFSELCAAATHDHDRSASDALSLVERRGDSLFGAE